VTPFVFGLVLLSAVLHVTWNTLAKTSRDKLAFAWLTTLGSVAFLALCFVGRRLLDPAVPPLPGGEFWLWAGVSGLMQALYVALLYSAYDASDLSLVYPLCRGLPPLFIMLLAGRLLGDTVTLYQGLAVGLIVVGTVAVGFTNRDVRGVLSLRGIMLSMVTAASTTGYTLADRKVMTLPGAPAAMDYLFVSYAVYMLWRRPGLAGAREEYRRSPRDAVLVSVLTPLAYGCVVAALGMGNVVLISAVRNVGILLSALAGFLLLRERASACRVSGVLMVSLGLVALALKS